MNPIISSKNHSLTLSDGTSWTIVSKGQKSLEFSEILAKTMRLHLSPQAIPKLLILNKSSIARTDEKPIFSEKTLKSVTGNNKVTCQITPSRDHAAKVAQLLELSQIFCCKAEERGGLAIHGALAEKNGSGIILAGRGDVGKTTASKRLPSPWISLSDDCSLIVLDKQKKYRAHPWPTWSSLVDEKKLETWDVQYSMPLKAIFILNQGKTDKVESIGKGHAACLLTAAADQAWWGLDEKLPDKEKLALRTKRFKNICSLVESIPVFLLDISLKGSFWKEIEKVLP